MSSAASVRLLFSEDVHVIVRARISYALRVFAAIYGYSVAESDAECGSNTVRLLYGSRVACGPDTRLVPIRYRTRPLTEPPPAPTKHRYAGEDFHLFYGVDETERLPDWLGEIFEWISSSSEMSIAERDSVGRIPYEKTVFGRQGISPRKPLAMMLMAWLDNYLKHGTSVVRLSRAPSPLPDAEHLVVCSHDLDFYGINRKATCKRLIKNLGVSLSLYRSWSFFASNARMILKLLGGREIGNYLPRLLRASQEYGFESTVFVVANGNHRRDPNYRVRELMPHLTDARKNGFSIGLHGSYQSILGKKDLRNEALALSEVRNGEWPRGNRQHWLRFDDHEELFSAIERAEFAYDTSLGFSETVGFRNGACFAFPPYDFRNERSFNLLEIPLALMDGNIEAAARTSKEQPRRIVQEILDQSRRWGWGGIAVLWHNPVEPLQVPDEINQLFWECLQARAQFGEKWISAEHFLRCCLSRYHRAGLLKGVGIDD